MWKLPPGRNWWPTILRFLAAFIWMAAAITDAWDLLELGAVMFGVVLVAAAGFTLWRRGRQYGRLPSDRQELLRQAVRVLQWRCHCYVVDYADEESRAVIVKAPDPVIGAELAKYSATFQFAGIGGDMHARGVVVESEGTSLYVVLTEVIAPPRQIDWAIPICPGVPSREEEAFVEILHRNRKG